MATEPLSLASSPLVSKLAAALAQPAKGAAVKTKEKLQVKFRKGFSRFIDEQRSRFSTVKTIISSSTPIPLLDLYVNLFLASEGKALRDDDFLTKIPNLRSVLFTATAGSGKSMLMRYLYLRFLEIQDDRLPVFLELRELNHQPAATLLDRIRTKISDYLDDFSSQQLKYAMESGRIILFLDGFDEIDHDKRLSYESQINELSARFKTLWIFASSRPAETFANWEKFHVYQVQPFTKQQVDLLITKISYDQEIKNLFRKKMAEGLYETHREFLRNPLLTIMMLITLEQFAEVPAKIHLFYDHAFEALFGRHDVTKGGFQRKRHTSLPLDDFKRLLSYFCMISYIREWTTFTSDKILELLQMSIDSAQISVDKVGYRNDLTESTCMLVLDGLDYTFSHRSFQEYFAAYFLSRVKADEIPRAVPKLIKRSSFDNVLTMLSEMNQEKFEEAWALPALNLLCDRVSGIDGCNESVEFSNRIWKQNPLISTFSSDPLALPSEVAGQSRKRIPIIVGDSQSKLESKSDAGSQLGSLSHIRMALYRVYSLFDKIRAEIKNTPIEDEVAWTSIVEGKLLPQDPRFALIRSSNANRPAQSVRIELCKDDDHWLSRTYFGIFFGIESRLLPQLRDEVAKRVAQRKKGLMEIFPE